MAKHSHAAWPRSSRQKNLTNGKDSLLSRSLTNPHRQTSKHIPSGPDPENKKEAAAEFVSSEAEPRRRDQPRIAVKKKS